MSKYAKINDNNIVENIIVCSDSEIYSQNGHHVKVTEETNDAHINDEYVAEKNKFKRPQPYESWVLNEDTLVWEAPVAKPSDAVVSPFGTLIGYVWDEGSLSWNKVS
jgi:hypothetical protein